MPLPVGPHPRSRGENNRRRVVAWARPGSSPLTRGKPTVTVGRRVTAGLIPARAGKTSRTAAPAVLARAHPRSRGENRNASAFRPLRTGSSRSRGENGRGGRQDSPSADSSPLTRGKPRIQSTISFDIRLIPAHAGKTLRRSARPRSGWAHPRSCGENHLMTSVAASLMGSSPLMPGRRGRRFDLFPGRGLIPAHAGKTSSPASPASRRQAHPRSYGENYALPWGRDLMSGSSPLTRENNSRPSSRS